jgi:hypothetical protein
MMAPGGSPDVSQIKLCGASRPGMKKGGHGRL